MKKQLIHIIPFSLVVFMGFLVAQTPVLIDEYVNVGRIDATVNGGQEGIFLEPTSGNLVMGIIVNRDSLHAYVSLDNGVSWTKSAFINASSDEVRNLSVSGDASSPIFVFTKRGSTPGAAPWARHITYVAKDDFGWGGGAFSLTPIATAGTEEDVLDSYYPQFDRSPFDANLRGVLSHHGSSQSGGEYQQFFYSTDGGDSWSDRIRIISSAAVDSLENYYVDDLTSLTPDFQYGPGGSVLASGVAKINTVTHDYYRLWYATSSDSGQTWSGVNLVPGAEDLEIDRGVSDRSFKVFLDGDDNFHVFALGKDASDIWAAYDFKLVSSTWTVNRFVEGQLLDDGLVAIEGDYGDEAPLNAPTLNSDGTIYYSFIDVADTIGGENDFRLYTVVSTDGGGTWSDRVQLIDDPEFNADEITDVARTANDTLHITYCKLPNDSTISTYYLKVPSSALSVGDEENRYVAEAFSLSQNYPNPFNASTTIRFDLKNRSQVSLLIYNLLGEQVASLITDEVLSHGAKEIVWDAGSFASGIYYYQLKTSDGLHLSKKMVLLK